MRGTRYKKQKLNILNWLVYIAAALVCAAACVLMFSVNVIPTVGLEQALRCGMPEHTHGDACYDGDFLICQTAAHVHDGNCYIVLLKENDINGILTLLGGREGRSLEGVIHNVVNTALVYNQNLNAPDSPILRPLDPHTVEQLNDTIADEQELPDIVLNENINTSEGVQLLGVGDSAVGTQYSANFYVYLDGKWTCIGNLPFTATRNGSRYNATIPTADVLELVNDSLGTEYRYSDFDLSVSTSQNGTYSKTNLSLTSSTATIAYRQSSSAVKETRYVHLIPKNGAAASTAFAFYTVRYVYPDGTETREYVRANSTVTLPTGNYEWTDGTALYAAGETVTVTRATAFTARTLGPITHVNVHYNVAFPSVSGVTVNTAPTIAGTAFATVTDEYSENAVATVRNVSQHSVQGLVNNNGTGLTRVIQFKGWRVGDSDTVLQPNTQLIWEELLQYSGNTTSVTLTAVWEYDPLQTASFFIRFDSVAVDTNGNVTSQDSNKYTQQLFAAYVGGVDTSKSSSQLQSLYGIADTTSDNSYGADQAIRALYGERTDGVWLSALPSDEYIFENLVQYANTGYLSVGGVPVKAEDLNSREYAIRWYVFKSQSDAWHIDGKLVKKVGLIHVYKTFAGNKQLVSEAKTDFSIDAIVVSTGENTVLDLNNYKEYDAATDTYMWELTDVEYGEYWTITEHPHRFEDPAVTFSVYSEYTVMDAHGDQSHTGAGTSLTVSGMTYALDEGIDEVLRAEFTNIYNRNDSIIIKKQDGRTGVPIGGAVFRLEQNGKTLIFTYDAASDRYVYDPQNGTVKDLSGNANGYYEICIDNFSYDLGPIVVREIKAPTGYSPIGNIEVGRTDQNGTIGILSGNSELIQYVGGVLIVGNSTDASSVTVQKAWDCAETEWQDVTVQLLANGKLVTTVIAGVPPQVVLNDTNAWQYTWHNLPVYVNGEKIAWSVRETAIGSETVKADGSFVNWLVSYGLPIVTTDADGKEHTRLTVTNTTKRVMLRLTKTDLVKTVQLKGAAFTLEAVDENGDLLSGEVSKSAVTGEAGTLIFDNLKCNIRYRLTETEAPSGYLKNEEYIYFTIQESGTVVVENSFYAEAGATAYNIVVKNGQAVTLPGSGAVGTGMFYVMGALLLALAYGVYIKHLQKRRCHNQ